MVSKSPALGALDFPPEREAHMNHAECSVLPEVCDTRMEVTRPTRPL